MATLVQAGVANGANGVTSIAAAYGSNVTAGSRLQVCVRCVFSVTMTAGMMTDTIGNTYDLDFQYSDTAVTRLGFYSCVNSSSAANTVTFNPASGSMRLGIGVWEFSGLDAYGSVSSGGTGTSTAPDSGNFTPGAATGVVMAAMGSANGITWEADYGTGAISNATGRFYNAYDLAPAAAEQSASGTIVSAQWACAAAWYPDVAASDTYSGRGIGRGIGRGVMR